MAQSGLKSLHKGRGDDPNLPAWVGRSTVPIGPKNCTRNSSHTFGPQPHHPLVCRLSCCNCGAYTADSQEQLSLMGNDGEITGRPRAIRDMCT